MAIRRLVRNAARCLTCSDVVESKDEDDHQTCTCGALTVWGGLAEAKRDIVTRPGGGWVDCNVELTLVEGGGEGGPSERLLLPDLDDDTDVDPD